MRHPQDVGTQRPPLLPTQPRQGDQNTQTHREWWARSIRTPAFQYRIALLLTVLLVCVFWWSLLFFLFPSVHGTPLAFIAEIWQKGNRP